MKYKSPIIVTGMHRSGTSLIVKILEENNVIIGSKLDNNLESVFFQRINKWILSCVGSSWDNPTSISHLDVDNMYLLINRVAKVLDNRIAKTLYFGLNNIYFNKNFFQQSSNWLWKDPVNTFTLPVWMKIFPDCKVINISRHPLDVSISLIKREEKLKKIDKKSQFPNIISLILPLLSIVKGDVLSSLNLKTIDDALILYKKYYNQIEYNSNQYKNIFNIKFEDLVSNSDLVLTELFNFLDIQIKNEYLTKVEKNINKNRSLAYKNKPINYDHTLLERINY